MNMRVVIGLVLLSLAVCNCAGFCAEPAAAPDEAAAQSIHFRAVPATLATQINDRLADLNRRHELPKADAEQIRDAVLGLDDRSMVPSINKANRDKLRQAGIAALPVLSALLESQDENTRLKAMSAMKQLLSATLIKEGTKSGDSQSASLQVALLKRAMCDKAVKVRRIALIALHGIAFGQPGIDSEEAKAGITEACADPDPEIQRHAEDYRQRLAVANLKQTPSP